MITTLTATTTSRIVSRLVEHEGTSGSSRVLTLVISTDEKGLEDALCAAHGASRDHPSRIIAVVKPPEEDTAGRVTPRSRDGHVPAQAGGHLDAEIRVGHDAGAGETLVLRPWDEAALHTDTLVVPFLLPDAPVVVWWPTTVPEIPSQDPLGRLGSTRITNTPAQDFPARALRALAPDRPMMRLIGLALLGFSPFLMDAAGWWSTAINAYAWQCTCAGVLWLGLRKHPWFAAIVLLVGLVFTEKSLTIMPVIVVLLLIIGKIRSHKLSISLLVVVTAGWLAVYLPHITFGLGGTTRTVTFGLPTALFQAIIPGAFGGPWQWSRWIPGKAFADPSMPFSIIAVIVLFALMFPAALRRPQRVLLLIPALGYLITIWFFLFTARGGEATSETLLRSMHYYVDWWSMTVLVGVAGLRLRNTTIIKVFTWVFVVSSMVSTGTWIAAWHTDPSREYLPNVRAALAREGDTILNQQTPLEVLTPLMHPYNWVSAIAGITPVNATTQPRVFDAHGLLHPARIEPVSRSQLGPEPECGYRVYSGGSVDIPINPGVPFGEWVWEFNSLASTDGMKVTITTPNGLEPIAATNSRAITVPAPTASPSSPSSGPSWRWTTGFSARSRRQPRGRTPSS